jgi:glycosyltransferase involved in cell wall biosynthesis
MLGTTAASVLIERDGARSETVAPEEASDVVPRASQPAERSGQAAARGSVPLGRDGQFSGFRVSVVIPALNEAENLRHVLPRIPSTVHEVLLVDGLSTDGTPDVARRLWPGVRLITQQGRGKGAALRSGFAAASGDIIVMLDADGSTDPREIPAFTAALLAGADLAKGSRFLPGGGTADMSQLRRVGNRVFVALVWLLFGARYSDLCYGYNAFWARVLPDLRLDGDGFEIETMINVRAQRAGLRVVEVPSFEARRVHGTGRLRTFPDGWRVLCTIWREWRDAIRIGRTPARWRSASPGPKDGAPELAKLSG